MTDDCYEIRAIKYASLMRRSPDNFIGGDAHATEMPLKLLRVGYLKRLAPYSRRYRLC